VLPVRFAAPLCTPVVFPCVPLTPKCMTISLNSLGNTQKYSAILGNARKYSEIPGNTRKYSETRVSACALRCTPVYPCVNLCTTRKYSEMLDNTPQSGGKYSEILGNTRKNSEILGNTRKYSEILGNKGFCLCASLHHCVPLCTPVYHPETLGNDRQYPSIRWEILKSTRKYSDILGNTRRKAETLGNTPKYFEILGNKWVLPVRFAAPL